jgi:predicted nucleic acid-binding Zn ribbon protein
MEVSRTERLVLVASYEYKCEKDSSTQTIQRGMTDDEIIPLCDACNAPMNRVYSAPPVKFNGSGFYSTGG